jgi:hypothetical protein
LKLTAKNDTVYNVIVSAAGIGLERNAKVGHQIYIRNNSGNRELDDEINYTVRTLKK